LATGCIHQPDRGTPLYDTAEPLQRHQVAVLSGYVRYVDGKEVSALPSPYELLPGCHVVGTPSSWGKGTQSGAIVAHTGMLQFALPMKAGHRYSIRVQASPMTGPTGPLTIAACESDAERNIVSTFGPVSDAADLAGCGEASAPARSKGQ